MLKELKGRIVYVCVGYTLVVLMGVVRKDEVMYRLVKELGSERLVSLGVLESLEIIVRMVLVMGLLWTIPLVWIEVLSYISSGLREEERRSVWKGVLWSQIMMVVGVNIGMSILVGGVYEYMEWFKESELIEVSYVGGIKSWYMYSERIVVMVVVLTQLPLLLRVVSVSRKSYYLGSVVISVMVSPPDISYQGMWLIPLWLGYEGKKIWDIYRG